MSKYFFRIIVLCFLIVSCSDKKEIQSENVIEVEEKTIVEETKNSENCNDFSDEVLQFIDVLEKDNYDIKYTQQDSLFFRKVNSNSFDIEEEIAFSNNSFKSFNVKRKHSVGGSSNTYPRFEVFEICFDSSEKAERISEKINEIIYNFDLFNDKNYDYIIINGNRIIYVSCNVKMFEEYAFSYKEKIEKIISNQK